MRDRRTSARLATCLSLALATGCGKPGGSPTTPPPSEPTPTTAAPQSLLQPVQGTWAGRYTLNWMDPAKSAFSEEASEGTATVVGDRIEYTWEFRGDPHRGTIELGQVGDDGVEMRFTDSWHTPDGNALVSRGSVGDGMITALGHYGGGEGPQWGWRTEVDVADPETFVFRMYNITPDGQEAIAAHFEGKRADSSSPGQDPAR